MKREEHANKLLRQRAEETLKGKRRVKKTPDQDLPSLVHELQVHQEELAVQNEELRQGSALMSSIWTRSSPPSSDCMVELNMRG